MPITEKETTVTLNGVTAVEFDRNYPYFNIRNDGNDTIYVSTSKADCPTDADGVISVPPGGSYVAINSKIGNVFLYLNGSGKASVIGKYDGSDSFKSSQGGGDSGTASGSVVGLQIEKYVDEQVNGDVRVYTSPYIFSHGSVAALNNEIHILGGSYSTGDDTKHYKYNGSSWEKVSVLPYNFYDGAAVVLDNEIHILGGSYGTGTYTKHYKYNGSSWEEVSTLPYNFYNGAAVVLGSIIYIIGGRSSSTKCYCYNSRTSKWSNTYTTLPYEFDRGSAAILNNKIHILGSTVSGCSCKHYIYSGSGWRNASTLLFGPSPSSNSACVLNGEIYYITISSLNIAKNGNRHIATMLPKGAHIMLSDNEDINYVKCR